MNFADGEPNKGLSSMRPHQTKHMLLIALHNNVAKVCYYLMQKLNRLGNEKPGVISANV